MIDIDVNLVPCGRDLGKYMKKMMLMALTLVLLIPCASWSFGFLNISSVELARLDADSYRLRVTYDWGGDLLAASVPEPDLYGPGIPSLTFFSLTGPAASYNIVSELSTAVISGQGSGMHREAMNNVYGFDFDYTDPFASSFKFDYAGDIHWYATHQNSLGFQPLIDERLETFGGSFNASVAPLLVPEPSTALLFGLGMLGFGLVRKRRR